LRALYYRNLHAKILIIDDSLAVRKMIFVARAESLYYTIFRADMITMMPVVNTSNRAILLKTLSSTFLDNLMPKVAPRNIMGTITTDEPSRSTVMRLPNKYAGIVAT